MLKLEGDLKEKAATKEALFLQTQEVNELKKKKETAFTELTAEGAQLRIKLMAPKAFDFDAANETIKKRDAWRGELMDSLEKLEKGLAAHQQQLEKLSETIHDINRQVQEFLLLIGEKARQFKEKEPPLRKNWEKIMS